MASNKWLGKLKSGAKSVQEAAKIRLEKVSETLDKTLKEAQEDLDRQRGKIETPSPHIQIWRPSTENPDGEIVSEAKPPPVEQSVIQAPLESPQTPTPVAEPITILRRNKPRSAKKNSLASVSSASVDSEIDLTNEQKRDSIKHSDSREDLDKRSDESIDKTSTRNELAENTTFSTMPQKEELILVQNSTNYSEDNIDVKKEEYISSKTELYQENIQMNITTDKLTPMTNINTSSIEHSDPENVPIKVPDNELPTLKNINDSSTVNSDLENILVNTPDDEPTTSTTIDNSPNTQSASENLQIKRPDDELPTLTITQELAIEHSGLENTPIKIPDNELSTSTNTDESSTVNSGPEIIPINTPDDEPTTSTTIDDEPNTQSAPENLQIKRLDDELPTLTNTQELPIKHSGLENTPIKISDNELSTSTNTDESSTVNSAPENILINIPDDEPTTPTTIDDSPNTQSAPENIQIKISADELSILTNTEELSIKHSGFESTPIKIPDNELSTSTNTDESPTVNSGPENIPINIPDDEPTTSRNIDDSPSTQSVPENIEIKISDDELPTSANIDDSPIEDSSFEKISINVPDDELQTLKNIDNPPNAHSDPENISINTSDDELPTTADILDSLTFNSGSENIPKTIPDDELSTLTNINGSPIKHSSFENTPINVPDGELSTLTSIDNTSDDELPTTKTIADSPIVNSKPENIPINISNDDDDDDELSTLTNINDVPMVDSGPKNIQMKISDEEFPALKNMDEISIAHSDAENISISTLDDELPTLSNIANATIEHSKSKDELPTLANVVESQIKHSDSNKNHSIISKNNIKMSLNELEDSFDELKTSNIPVHRPSEEPSASLTHLAALRAFISKIEGEDDNDDDDDDDEPISPKQDISILKKNVNTVPEQFNIPNIMTNTLSSSSTSISDDPPEDIITETLVRSDSLNDEAPYNEINESVSTMSIETKPVETRRFSVVNCHSIPTGTKVYHINCSSTYIYICTIDRKIFYAKLNLNDINYPFKWQQHSDLAERIIVSISNRTLWRLFKKHLYTSNDPIKFPPFGSQWNEIKMDNEQSLLSISINDQCGWYIKDDGTLWLLRTDDSITNEPLNVTCPFHLNTVFCFSEKVGVTTSDGEILIRVGCTNDCPEGDGWIFIEHNFGPIDDFILLTNNNIITLVDKQHHLWVHQWSSDKGFYQILCNDEFSMSHQRYLISVNSELLCFTDCEDQIHIFSDCLIGVQWITIAKNTRLQRLIGAFPNEDYVWALTTDKMISASNGQILDKPRQAQYITHATFVPNNSSQNTVLWSLDESCSIYVRANVENDKQWEQVDRSQFDWNRRIINIVCNHAGVWAVDDRGYIHFRHGHMSASQNIDLDELSFLPPAWIPIPGEPQRNRCFAQVYCGPADWMVYATDNKQDVYTRDGINKENRIGTSWKPIEDCSALELAISENTLWLLTSHGQIQCRENISLTNPIGTRSTTLPGRFLSLTVSIDDSQVWALDSQRNLLKLDRLTVLLEK